MNKRFAGIIAGTVLTASAVLVPGAAAQPHTHDGRAGDYTSVTVRDGLADMHGQYVFVPHGTSLASGGACYDDSALLIDKLTPVAGWSGYYTVDASCLTSAQPGDDADEQQGVPRPGDQNQTPGDQGQVPGCQTPVQQEQEQEQGQVPVEDCQIPVVPEPGDCINLPGDCHDDVTEDDTEEEKEEGSSVVGGAFLGLSALAGLAFLSSQGGGSSASSDADAPAPSTAPATPAAPTTAPATGPVGGPDAKAEAQASRAAQPSPAATTAPAAPVAPEPVAEQKALANTGVEGTLGALAIGLVAVAAGVLLILRRRSF